MALSVVQGFGVVDTVDPFEIDFPLPTTVGNLLVIGVTWQSTSDINVGVSDSSGQVYTALTERQNPGTQNAWAQLFYFVNTDASQHTVTAQFSLDPGTAQLWLLEVGGANTNGVLENGAESDNVASLNAGSLTPTTADAILVGLLRTTGDRTISAPASWTVASTALSRSLMAYRIVSSIATYEATFSWTSGTSAVGATAAFKSSTTNSQAQPGVLSATLAGTTSPLGFTINMPGQFT